MLNEASLFQNLFILDCFDKIGNFSLCSAKSETVLL